LKNKNSREQANVTNENNNNEHYEQVLATIATEEYEIACRAIVPNNIFLCDSGASRHMTNDLQAMVNVRDVNTSVQIGDGKVLYGSKEGDMKVTTKKSDGSLLTVTLKDLLFVPDLKCNLLLVGKLRERGTVVYDKEGAHIILQDKSKINFKPMIGQSIFGLELERDTTYLTTTLKQTMTFETAHQVLGHASKDMIAKTAASQGWTLKGDMKLCEECVKAKQRQKNVPKSTATRASAPGERVFIDLSKVDVSSLSGSKFWGLIVNDYTRYKWPFYLKTKDKISERAMPILREIKANFNLKYVRMDNAGENQELARQIKLIGVDVEFVAPNTPQTNGVVERSFVILAARG